MDVKIKLMKGNSKLPTQAREGDACVDLVATSVETDNEDIIVYGLGIATEFPSGYVMLVFPRSSVRKYDLEMVNSVGVIDSGYRGEWQATFRKTKADAEVYKIGDRVCQTMLVPLPPMKFVQSENLSESIRGCGGHGSTGQ